MFLEMCQGPLSGLRVCHSTKTRFGCQKQGKEQAERGADGGMEKIGLGAGGWGGAVEKRMWWLKRGGGGLDPPLQVHSQKKIQPSTATSTAYMSCCGKQSTEKVEGRRRGQWKT